MDFITYMKSTFAVLSCLFLQQIKSHLFTVITLDSLGHVAQSVTTHHQVSRCIQRIRKSQKDEKEEEHGRQEETPRPRFRDVFLPRQLFFCYPARSKNKVGCIQDSKVVVWAVTKQA